MRKYNYFEIGIYNEDEDIKHTNNLIKSPNNLCMLNIKYELNLIPKVELILALTGKLENLITWKNIFCKIILLDKTVYKFNIGIDSIKVAPDSKITIIGYLCKYSDFTNIESSYLGDSLISSLKSLNIRPKIKINGKNSMSEEFTSDFNKDYWMIQETKVDACLRLLNLAYPNSIFSFDDDSIIINSIDNIGSKKLNDFIPPDIHYYTDISSRFKNLNENNNTNILDYTDENSTFNYISTFGKTIINSDNNTELINYKDSFPYRLFCGDIIMKCKYNKRIFPYNLGECMNKEKESKIGLLNNYCVISKIIRFDMDTVESIVLLSSIN